MKLARRALLALIGFSCCLTAERIQAEGRALIFSPAQYKNLPQAPQQLAAANRLKSQLIESGLVEKDIVHLSGATATVERLRRALITATDTASEDELFLVVVCAHGLQFDDVDYICGVDAPSNCQQMAKAGDPRFMQVKEVLEEMAVSASTRRLLVLDGSGVAAGPLNEAARQFGRRSLATSDWQWTIVNRSRRIEKRDDGPRITSFVWSLVDGLARHADGNRDSVVSALELSAYMKLYAQAMEIAEPRFAGKAAADIKLVKSSTVVNTAESRRHQRNTQALLAEIETALLFDFDVDAVMALVDRARRLGPTKELGVELDEYVMMTRFLKGKADDILSFYEEEGKVWRTVLPQDSVISPSGQILKAGAVIEMSSKATNGFVRVVSAFTPKRIGQRVELAPIENDLSQTAHWIEYRYLLASPAKAIENDSLNTRLGKASTPTAPEQLGMNR